MVGIDTNKRVEVVGTAEGYRGEVVKICSIGLYRDGGCV